MIEPEVYSYTPVSLESGIGASLAAFNAGFQALADKQVTAAVVLAGGMPRFYGGEVTAGSFPALNVAAGKLLLGDGTVYSFPAGSLSAPSPGAADVFSVYVSEDFELDIVETVPGTALLVLATATVNGGVTAFSVIDQGVLNTVTTATTANGDVETEELRSGSIVLKTTEYTYDDEDRPETSVETTDAKTTTKTFVYDEDTGALVRTDEIVDPFGFFLPAGT